FGEYGKDPELFPVEVFWDADFTVPAAQPIRTRNGYPVRNGSPTKIYLKATQHSIAIKNRKGAFVLVDFKNKGWLDIFITWSGRTQEDKNKELISAQDFGAIGDGVTNDTQAFVELESVYKGQTIDLQGRTYNLTNWFSANTYVNGKFLIFGNLYSADLDVYAFTQKSHAMNFYTGDSSIGDQPEIF